MKKLTILVLVATLLFSAAACSKNEPKDMFEGFTERAAKYAEQSVKLNDLVKEKYFVTAAKSAYHYYPNKTEDSSGNMSTAYAWPYTEMVAASYRVGTLSAGSLAAVKDYYVAAIEGFEYYLAGRNDYVCYCASRSAFIGQAGGDTYYDDNIWISREFLNAYELLGNEEYLTKSVGVAEYIWSGWANDELGGIYWKEQGKTSRNTCSNAPAVILFGRLYELTKDQKYLDRAKSCYDFCYNNLRDPSDNVYWDNISNAGAITNWKFTYNTGGMIAGGVKLYEITGEQKYLEQAAASALGAFGYWFKQGDRDYPTITSDNPWFNVLLLDGFTELYRYKKEALKYIEAYEANLNYAYDNLLSSEGFMPSNWVNGFGKDANGNTVLKDVNILDMAANAENFGHLAYFYQNNYGRE